MNIWLKTWRCRNKETWNYYRDEPSNPLSSDSESFKYKTSITWNTYNVPKKIADDDSNQVDNSKYGANEVGKNKTQVVILLKHLSNFWRSLNIPLINCEVGLILTWSKNCVLADMTTKDAEGNNPSIVAPVVLTFEITDTKLYVPVVTLSKENDTKLLEQLKLWFERTMKWNNYRSQMTIQAKNNNLNYLTDPTFTNFNRLFILPFTRTDACNYRNFFSHYYVPDAEIKYFNVLIDGKSFFDLPVKMKKKLTKKLSRWVPIMITQLLDFIR